MSIQLDHVALGLWKVRDAAPVLAGVLGGVPSNGGPGPGYRGGQWSFRDGERIETLEPYGEPGGFLHRFLEKQGPGIHHVTFKVPSLRATCDRAERLGYSPVGYDDSSPYWKEAFLHPKQSLGIVVQLAETHPAPGGADSWQPGWFRGDDLSSAPAPVRVLGPRLCVRDAALARRQWGELLEGACSAHDDELLFRWPDSPLHIAVRINPDAPEGPEAIEVATERPLPLPDEPYPDLGTRFVQVRS